MLEKSGTSRLLDPAVLLPHPVISCALYVEMIFTGVAQQEVRFTGCHEAWNDLSTASHSEPSLGQPVWRQERKVKVSQGRLR